MVSKSFLYVVSKSFLYVNPFFSFLLRDEQLGSRNVLTLLLLLLVLVVGALGFLVEFDGFAHPRPKNNRVLIPWQWRWLTRGGL